MKAINICSLYLSEVTTARPAEISNKTRSKCRDETREIKDTNTDTTGTRAKDTALRLFEEPGETIVEDWLTVYQPVSHRRSVADFVAWSHRARAQKRRVRTLVVWYFVREPTPHRSSSVCAVSMCWSSSGRITSSLYSQFALHFWLHRRNKWSPPLSRFCVLQSERLNASECKWVCKSRMQCLYAYKYRYI